MMRAHKVGPYNHCPLIHGLESSTQSVQAMSPQTGMEPQRDSMKNVREPKLSCVSEFDLPPRISSKSSYLGSILGHCHG